MTVCNGSGLWTGTSGHRPNIKKNNEMAAHRVSGTSSLILFVPVFLQFFRCIEACTARPVYVFVSVTVVVCHSITID